MRWFTLAVGILWSGRYSQLRPGRCDRSTDCAAGLVCDLSPTPQGNGRCVVPLDGGLDVSNNSGDVGVEAIPECVRDITCPEVRPACSSSGTCVSCAMAGAQVHSWMGRVEC